MRAHRAAASARATIASSFFISSGSRASGLGHDRAVERAVGADRARLVLGREVLERALDQRLDPLGVVVDDLNTEATSTGPCSSCQQS